MFEPINLGNDDWQTKPVVHHVSPTGLAHLYHYGQDCMPDHPVCSTWYSMPAIDEAGMYCIWCWNYTQKLSAEESFYAPN